MSRRRIATAAVAVIVLAGCSGSHDRTAQGTAAAAGPVVPWTAAVPAQLRPRAVPAAAPCGAAQLAVVKPGLQLTPVGAGGAGTITVRNTGGRPCRLTGRPAVHIVGAPYHVAQHELSLPPARSTFPELRPPTSMLLALPAGGFAELGVEWSNWCPPRPRNPATRLVPPRAVRVGLPGGGSLDVDYDAVPDCTAPGQPSTIGVRPFAPAPLPATRPWTTVKVTASILPLGGALAGRRGQPARYAVRLHNASATALRLAPCPFVVEALEPAGAPEAHLLNCAAAGTLAPGASVTFDMRITVPADAPLGRNGLFWELDPTGAQGPEAVSALRVSR